MPSRRAGFWIVRWDLNGRRFCGKRSAVVVGRTRSERGAVTAIVEREREIMDFKAAAYYRVLADFTVTDADGKKSAFRAELSKRYATEQEALALLEKCKTAVFTVRNVERKPSKKSPAAPFTTSTLQQEAGRKLGMSVSQTMSVAQRLHEAGYITYMRTDSVNLSDRRSLRRKRRSCRFGEKIFGSPQL